MLAGLGFEVASASDGHEALRLFRRDRPGVLIADMALPGLDGFRLTQAVQAESAPARADFLPPDVSAPAGRPEPASAWRVSLRLGAAQIRHQDVVPLLLNVAAHFELSRPYDAKLFLLLSEMYGNALDHGLLCLDPGLKRGENGLQRYGRARSQCLETLVAGEIEMLLEQVSEGDASVLHISCRDSGQGFDHGRIMAEPLLDDGVRTPDAGQLSGSGIPMLRRQCSRVEFMGCGNEIRVSYPLNAAS